MKRIELRRAKVADDGELCHFVADTKGCKSLEAGAFGVYYHAGSTPDGVRADEGVTTIYPWHIVAWAEVKS